MRSAAIYSGKPGGKRLLVVTTNTDPVTKLWIQKCAAVNFRYNKMSTLRMFTEKV